MSAKIIKHFYLIYSELKFLPNSVFCTRMFCSLTVVNIDTLPDIYSIFVGLQQPILLQGRFYLCIIAFIVVSIWVLFFFRLNIFFSLSPCLPFNTNVYLTFVSNFQRSYIDLSVVSFDLIPFFLFHFLVFYLFVTRQMYS